MKLNLITSAVVVVTILSAYADGPQNTAWGQTVTGVPATRDLTKDSFADNKRGGLWKLFQDDPTNCKVTEVNSRLELTATSSASDAYAAYVGNGWWIDTNSDFAFKVDLFFDVVRYGKTWVCFGVTTDAEKPRDKYIALGIGSTTGISNYRNEWQEGAEVRANFASRFNDRVTLYVSYSAFRDELYLSDTGYWAGNAWETFTEIVWDKWRVEKVYVFLGGMVAGSPIDAGHAYLDNFVVDEGIMRGVIPPDPPITPNDPTDPTDPTDPNDPNAVLQDIASVVVVVPSVISRSDLSKPVTAATTLPAGVVAANVKQTEMLVLTPGNVKAKSQTVFTWLNGQAVVAASFNRAELMQAIPTNGVVNLRLTGWLKDGRKFGGNYSVTIQ